MKFRNTIDINTPKDWENVASDVIDGFLMNLPDKDEFIIWEWPEENKYCLKYTERSMGLYNRLVTRLDKLGNAMFPGATFEYTSQWMLDTPDYGEI